MNKDKELQKLKDSLPHMNREQLIEIVKFLMKEYDDLVNLFEVVSTHANLLSKMAEGFENVVGVVVLEEEQ